jgi:hypothetical protein
MNDSVTLRNLVAKLDIFKVFTSTRGDDEHRLDYDEEEI